MQALTTNKQCCYVSVCHVSSILVSVLVVFYVTVCMDLVYQHVKITPFQLVECSMSTLWEH